MKKTGKTIALMAAIIVLIVFGYALIGNIFLSRPYWIFDAPKQIIGEERFISLFYVVAVIIYFALLIIIFKLVEKYFDFNKINKIILFAGPVLMLCVCAAIPVAAYADQANMIRIPIEIWQGNFNEFFNHNYLDLYPNNIGTVLFFLPSFILTLIDPIVGKISGIIIIRLIQILCTTQMIYYLGKIFLLYMPNKSKYLTLLYLLAFSSLPLILMVNLIYGDVIATFLIVMGLYYYLSYCQGNSKIKSLYLGYIFVGFANIFRSLGVIVLIAMTIHYFYNFGCKKWYNAFLGILVFIGIKIGIDLTTALVFSLKLPIGSNGMPITSWIQMGLTGEFGYWTGYGILDVWIDDTLSLAEKKTIYWNNIKTIINNRGFSGIIELFANKMHYLFGEGTYQIELNGLGVEETIAYNGIGAWYYSTFVTKLLSGENSVLRRLIINFQYVVNMFTLGLAMIGIVSKIRKPHIGTTFIAGVMVFYCLWELKTRYIYIILPFILLFATIGLIFLLTCVNKIVKKARKSN